MRIFKIKHFHRWAKKHELGDESLTKSAHEVKEGLVDANLGGNLYKKRIGTRGRGKRGSVRTLLAYHSKERIVFLFAFEKSQRENIEDTEKVALRKLGNFVLNLSEKELAKRLSDGSLIEVVEV